MKQWFDSFNPTHIENRERRTNLARRAVSAVRFENVEEIEKVSKIWAGAMLWRDEKDDVCALEELSNGPGGFAFDAGQAWARAAGALAHSESTKLVEMVEKDLSSERKLRAGPLAFACGAASDAGCPDLMEKLEKLGKKRKLVEMEGFGLAEWMLWGGSQCASLSTKVKNQVQEREALAKVGAVQSWVIAWEEGLDAGLALAAMVDRDAGAPGEGWLWLVLEEMANMLAHDVRDWSSLVVDGLNHADYAKLREKLTKEGRQAMKDLVGDFLERCPERMLKSAVGPVDKKLDAWALALVDKAELRRSAAWAPKSRPVLRM